jgi:predicted RND superfamily exporter protein
MSSVVRFRIPILIVLLAVTAFLCLQLGNIRLAPDPLSSLYPSGHPFLPALQAIEKMAPEPRMLIAILEVKTGDIYNRQTIRKIDRITKGLTEVEGVLPGRITSLTRGMDHYENTGEGLEMGSILGMKWPETDRDFQELKRKVAVNPRGPGRFVSYDGTAAMISAALVDGNEEALMGSLPGDVEAIRSREVDARHNLYFMGPQLIQAQMTDLGSRHIPVAAAGTFFLILTALLAYFRTLRGALLPLVVMVLSLLWTIGMLGASGVAFNPMPLVFPLILGLFSLVYGILVMEQYERAYPRTRDKAQAIYAAYGRARVAGSIATTGMVLVSLFSAPVPIFKGLAWVGLFWFISTGAVVGLFLPILISLVRVPGTYRSGRMPPPTVAGAPAGVSSGRRRPVLLGFLSAVLVVGALSATGLEVGDNVPGSSYIRPGHPWNACFRVMAEKFLGPYQFLVYVKANEKGGLLDPEALLEIGDFSRYLRKHAGARDSIAFDMMVKAARNIMMDGNPKWQTVPLSREQVKGMGELVVDQGGVESFVDRTFTEATISPFFPEVETGRIEEYASAMQGYIDRHPSDRLVFRLGGGLLGMTKAVNDGTREVYGKTLAVAFVLVFVAGVLVTGSLRSSLAAVLPIAAAQGTVWMIMAVAGIKINVPVALVSAVAVGFCPVFSFFLIREMKAPVQGADPCTSDVHPPFQAGLGAVLFLGGLVFTALLPWFFIGLRFASQMALALGVSVFLAAVGAVLFVPPLTARRPAGSASKALEEQPE